MHPKLQLYFPSNPQRRKKHPRNLRNRRNKLLTQVRPKHNRQQNKTLLLKHKINKKRQATHNSNFMHSARVRAPLRRIPRTGYCNGQKRN